MVYRLLYGRVLSRWDAETVHVLTATTLGRVQRVPGVLALPRPWAGRPDPALETHALGRTFPSPLGVAAGLDKNLDWFEALGALGFGFGEVGTVTPRAQPRNPPPP